MKKIIVILLLAGCFVACHRKTRVVEATGEVIMVDRTLDAIQDSAYLLDLAPIKANMEHELNIPIGYAPEALQVYAPECPMLNWASDALLAMAKQLYPNKVDMAVVNIGGMRTDWGAGDITRRHIFELMPFDNELVVLTMTGEEVLALCHTIVRLKGEGVAGLRIKARNGKLLSATIDGKEYQIQSFHRDYQENIIQITAQEIVK